MPKKKATRDARVQFNLKVDRRQGQLLRRLAKADGRTISGYISVHFLSRLPTNGNETASEAPSPVPADELSVK